MVLAEEATCRLHNEEASCHLTLPALAPVICRFSRGVDDSCTRMQPEVKNKIDAESNSCSAAVLVSPDEV